MHLASGVEGDEDLAVGGGRELGGGDVEEAALNGLVGGGLAELDTEKVVSLMSVREG